MAVLAVAAAVLLAAGSSDSTVAHPFLAGRSFDGSRTPAREIGRACGMASDSKGDLYISSPGTSAIDVFGADGRYLGGIPNSKKPCALGVDSKGDVYALESATGEVVRYAPSAYPFRGRPSYGAPHTIDASGKATAIAVDPSDGRLYVAKGNYVDVYNRNGTVGQDAVQQVYLFAAKGGSFTLSFEDDKTGPIPYDATDAQLEAALSRLSTIGPGSVSVKAGPGGRGDHLVTFTGALARTSVAPIGGDDSNLKVGHLGGLNIENVTAGFSGQIGKGVLSKVSAIAAYSYAGSTHYLFVADAAGAARDRVYVFAGGSVRTLRRRATINGSETPGKSIGFGPASAHLGVDPKDGHLYLYDAKHAVIDEFEATGPYLAQIAHSSFREAEPAGIAVDRSGDAGGTVYVAGGPASGAEVLAFGPRPAPHRPSLPGGPPGGEAENCGIAVDSHGDVYVSGGTTIKIYDPEGGELNEIVGRNRPCDLAVDSEGDVYASLLGGPAEEEGGRGVAMYRPDSYPPTASTRYGKPEAISSQKGLRQWVAVNPSNDHLFVNAGEFSIAEYGSTREGSKLISDEIGKGLLNGIETFSGGLGVCGRNGDLYASGRGETGWRIYVIDPRQNELLTAIDGSGSPRGPFPNHSLNIAVDQSSCHVFMVDYNRAVEEYEASGAFVTEFGPEVITRDVAVDNSSSSPNQGSVYALAEKSWLAFGPLSHAAP